MEEVAGNISGGIAVDAIGCARVNLQATSGVIHSVPLRMIEYVESLGAELHAHRLAYLEVLEESHIKVETTRTNQGIAA
jgi:hypothetical protein